MNKKVKWVGTLSTTERNNIGLIQVRQNNVNSETLGFNIVDGNGEPYDLKNRKVLFCTYFDRFAPVEQYAEVIENGKIIYTMNEHDMQKPVRINFAYFKILDKKDNLVDTTQNFSYDIMPSIESKCMNSEPYIIRLEELFDIYQDFYKQQKQEADDYHEKQIEIWESFFNAYREIIESVDPGGILLKEIVEARGLYPTLNDRLNNFISYNRQVEGLISNVPSERVEQVKNFKNKLSKDKTVLKILYYRDLHHMESIKNEYNQANKMVKNQLLCASLLSDLINLAILNGDNVHDDENINLTRLRHKQVSNLARISMNGKDTFISLGNHDDHSVYGFGTITAPRSQDKTIRLNEFNSLWQNDLYSYNEIKPKGKTYLFKDYLEQKVRVVVLNGFENQEIIVDGNVKHPRVNSSIYDQEQIDWFANEALKNVPEGFAVIVFTHAPLEGFFNNKPYPNYRNIGHKLIIGIANAFQNGTFYTGKENNEDFPSDISVNFEEQGKRDLIGIVFGHEHRDASPQFVEGVRGILRTSNLCAGSYPLREINTATEFAIDVIEINQKIKKCTIKRCGAGDDLTFNY